jgi:Flp pilus assembly protein TadG
MKKSHTPRIGRNSERGAIAILIAAMWTTLFGLAALAVDVGYLYTRQRGLQAVTDAAVTAAMPTYQSTGFNPASIRATAVASANGYSTGSGTTVTVDQPVVNQFRVRVSRTFPTFFGSVLGISQKTITATSVGRVVATAGPVIHASNMSCGAGFGFTATGSATMNVTGDIESNGVLNLAIGGALTGSAKVRTACQPTQPQISGYTAPTIVPSGSPFADPLLGITPASFAALCTSGSIAVAGAWNIAWSCGTGPGGEDVVPSGVYCSLDSMSITSPCPAQRIYAPDSTWVSATGQVQFGGNNPMTLGNYPGVPGNVVVITMSAGTPAIHLGSANKFTVNGAVYAPLGEIMMNGGGTGPNLFNGRLVGDTIYMGVSALGTWTFTGGGPGGSAWSLYQ